MHDLRRYRVNFVALTPATSFEQTGGGGRIDERVLLYWLLDRAWGIHKSRASLYVMRDYAGTASFKRGVAAFDFTKLNEQIADEFVASLAKQVQEETAAWKPDLRTDWRVETAASSGTGVPFFLRVIAVRQRQLFPFR